MAIIKNLAFCSKEMLKKNSFAKSEIINNSIFPLNIINSCLPLKLKFLTEAFALIDDNKIQAVTTLEKDNYNRKHLIFSQFFTEESSINCAELLINDVVNNFYGKGAEIFSVAIDEIDLKHLKLFTDFCKFRVACNEFLFKIKKSDFPYEKNNCFGFVRFSKNSEAKQISKLYNGMISSHLLPVFHIEDRYFKENLFIGFRNEINFRYVLENIDKKQLFGYFTISTSNNKEFILEAVLPAGYEVYLTDILKFARYEISKRTNIWTLYLKIRSCFFNYKELLNIIENDNLKCFKKSKILVRDMCKPVKADIIKGKQIIFNDITPAY